MEDSKLNDDTSLGINLKWLIQIVVVAAMAVWGYFGIHSKIGQLEIDVLRMKDAVEMNSEFRVKWPLGQLGALPDDAEQNMRLRFIEKDMDVMEAHVDTLRIKAVQQQELHNPPHPFLPAVEYPKKTETGGIR
ncbi:hypothetical protein CMI37_13690 [Candidatus Pacearchaeota archaeon]|nr:hypothetical protein [Candidatus Pacearchaeota archaeon]|tara:strand:- start:247 stop:645 length:399 start_codon:yes stop_codon:yes gene_type:complete